MVIWYASRLATASSLSKLFQWPKNASPKTAMLWNHLDWCLMACWPEIAYFSGILLSHIFPLDINDTSNHEPKASPFKMVIIWEEILQAGSPSIVCVVPEVDKPREKKNKNKRKIDCHVMHLKDSIKSKRESRSKKKCWENDEKTT